MIFLLALLIFPAFCFVTLGDPLVHDGVGTLKGYAGTVYQVVKFVPVCRTLAAANTQPFDIKT
jgi:hypothetical protein